MKTFREFRYDKKTVVVIVTDLRQVLVEIRL